MWQRLRDFFSSGPVPLDMLQPCAICLEDVQQSDLHVLGERPSACRGRRLHAGKRKGPSPRLRLGLAPYALPPHPSPLRLSAPSSPTPSSPTALLCPLQRPASTSSAGPACGATPRSCWRGVPCRLSAPSRAAGRRWRLGTAKCCCRGRSELRWSRQVLHLPGCCGCPALLASGRFPCMRQPGRQPPSHSPSSPHNHCRQQSSCSCLLFFFSCQPVPPHATQTRPARHLGPPGPPAAPRRWLWRRAHPFPRLIMCMMHGMHGTYDTHAMYAAMRAVHGGHRRWWRRTASPSRSASTAPSPSAPRCWWCCQRTAAAPAPAPPPWPAWPAAPASASSAAPCGMRA